MSEIKLLISFVISFLTSLIMIPFVIKIANLVGILDHPDKSEGQNGRRVHEVPVPRIGGVGIFISVLIPSFIFFDLNYVKILLISSLIFVVGLWDDIKNISWKIRIVSQFLVSIFIIFHFKLHLETLNFGNYFYFELPQYIGFAFSIFILVGAINSTNMIDGLDGLAGGILLIGFTFLSMIYFTTTGESKYLVSILFPVIGAILGFLRYNTHPATVFMGDGGSNWLGFLLGITFLIVLKGGSHFGNVVVPSQMPNLFSVLVCFAVPIYDTACVITSRMLKGKRPTSPDKTHFHHTLLRLGLSHSQSVASIYFIAMIMGVSGLIPIALVSKKLDLNWIPFVSSILLFAILIIGLNSKTTKIHQFSNSKLLVSNNTKLGRQFKIILRYWETINRYIIYFILGVLPLFIGAPKPSIGYAAGITCVLLFISMIFARKKNDFTDTLILSISIGTLLVAINQNVLKIYILAEVHNIQHLYNNLFVFLSASALLFILITMRKRYLIVTPSDFLVMILPLTLIFLPDALVKEYRIYPIVLRSLVVFAVLRTFVKRRTYSIHNIKMLTVFGLMIVFMTGVLGLQFIY